LALCTKLAWVLTITTPLVLDGVALFAPVDWLCLEAANSQGAGQAPKAETDETGAQAGVTRARPAIADRIVKTPNNSNAADLLAEAGRTLYGEEWIAPLARAIGVSAHTLRAWKAGRLHLSLADDAIKETVHLLERKRDEADRVATHIKQLISAAR
jgi:hypothetical protein